MAPTGRPRRASTLAAAGGRTVNTALGEVRRLRQALADKEHDLAELRGLLQAHLEATTADHR
jgi:hypothetical protein